ncbi:unnamed protein product [Pylaiella littoralis]
MTARRCLLRCCSVWIGPPSVRVGACCTAVYRSRSLCEGVRCLGGSWASLPGYQTPCISFSFSQKKRFQRREAFKSEFCDGGRISSHRPISTQ